MKAYIVTGTTRGLGRAIAQEVVAAEDQLLSLSSARDNEELFWRNIECDLSRYATISEKLKLLIETVSSEPCGEMVLINNAGILDPMGPLQEASAERIVDHLLINQAAPAVLMSAFIRMTENVVPSRRIINISSGAAKHPYPGWALYCGSKAALDMMTLCAAKEQANSKSPVAVCAVYPGKVETGMQRQIRASDPAKFPKQQDFVAAKDQGEISNARETARLILALDGAGEFDNGGIYDLRDAQIDGNRYAITPLNVMAG